jgi:hypothetical protein
MVLSRLPIPFPKMRHKRRRHHLAKPLPILSGKVLLLEDFAVDPRQGAGFTFVEIDIADLPEEAMYFAKNKDTGQTIFQLPVAREKHARWRMTASVDPRWGSRSILSVAREGHRS